MTPPLRIAFDMDGTLADLSAAYAEVERQLFGAADEDAENPAPEVYEEEQHGAVSGESAERQASRRRQSRRRSRYLTSNRESVWKKIEATPNFWTTLEPLENGAIERLYRLTREMNWEVFFITQRPATAGRTVQWQTQTWLVDHGFPTPSVIPLSGGRGRAAAALRLDYLVDDTPQNCVDVLSDSSARAILLVEPSDSVGERSARRLGIGVAHSVHAALDLLVQLTEAHQNPSLFEKIRKMVGWK
jgi:hypothetical protein